MGAAIVVIFWCLAFMGGIGAMLYGLMRGLHI